MTADAQQEVFNHDEPQRQSYSKEKTDWTKLAPTPNDANDKQFGQVTVAAPDTRHPDTIPTEEEMRTLRKVPAGFP